jgi:carboxymethylenebutenolidase
MEPISTQGISFRISVPPAPQGGLILFHHRTGFDDFTIRIARQLSAAGFSVVAPDLFSGLPSSLSPEELKMRLDDESVLTSVVAGRAMLRGDGICAVSAIGFCMGGRLAFLAGAEGLVNSAVSFYGGDLDTGRRGGPSPLSRMARSSSPIQLHRGSRDSAATAPVQEAAVLAADSCGAYLEACTYAGARHAFLNSDDELRFNRVCSVRAWSNAMRFLEEHTRSREGASS